MRRMGREVKSVFGKKDGTVSEDISEAVLYQDVNAVGTTLNITNSQQYLLLQAGREAVEQHREFLMEHLN